MNYSEEFLELLLRDELTPEEQKRLDLLKTSDKNAEALLQFYNLTKSAVSNSSLPSPEELRDFILIKMNQQPFDKRAYKKQSKIERIINSNPDVENEYKLLLSEFSEIQNFLSDSFKQVSVQPETESLKMKRFFSATGRTIRYFIISLMILLIGYAGLFTYSELSIPGSYKIAEIEEEINTFSTRGRYSDDFVQSIAALEDKDYNKAIYLLKEDIRKYPDDETIFYSYYILGITCLESAEKSYAGLFPYFDSEKAEEGLKYLLLSAERNNSGKYPDLVANAYYFSAKACVMLDKYVKAKHYFAKVIELRGSRMEEAKKLINELE